MLRKRLIYAKIPFFLLYLSQKGGNHIYDRCSYFHCYGNRRRYSLHFNAPEYADPHWMEGIPQMQVPYISVRLIHKYILFLQKRRMPCIDPDILLLFFLFWQISASCDCPKIQTGNTSIGRITLPVMIKSLLCQFLLPI